ncbi:hypothetical protein AMECASPLE_034533 [Ameca splendens]|uniref:Uncharacterized protein n=1 Tax=Ameca splendens TaxID=208324 RepID=A0ABV0ZRY9_9TELE
MVRQDRVMRKYCYVFTLNAICQHKVQRMKTKVDRFVNVFVISLGICLTHMQTHSGDQKRFKGLFTVSISSNTGNPVGIAQAGSSDFSGSLKREALVSSGQQEINPQSPKSLAYFDHRQKYTEESYHRAWESGNPECLSKQERSNNRSESTQRLELRRFRNQTTV